MLYETQQKEPSFWETLSPVVTVLLALNVGIYFLERSAGLQISDKLALYSLDTHWFAPYQFLTHMFLHGDFGHLFMNMFGLYMFGIALERLLGTKRFLLLYFVSGLGAAGLQFFIYYLQQTPGAMIGASGAIFGVLAAYAFYFPNHKLIFLFLPFPIKAKYFVPIYGAVELFMGAADFEFSNIAHFAHLGGAIVGFILVLMWRGSRARPR